MTSRPLSLPDTVLKKDKSFFIVFTKLSELVLVNSIRTKVSLVNCMNVHLVSFSILETVLSKFDNDLLHNEKRTTTFHYVTSHYQMYWFVYLNDYTIYTLVNYSNVRLVSPSMLEIVLSKIDNGFLHNEKRTTFHYVTSHSQIYQFVCLHDYTIYVNCQRKINFASTSLNRSDTLMVYS